MAKRQTTRPNRFGIAGVIESELGLVLPASLTRDDCIKMLNHFAKESKTRSWQIGDLAIFIEANYGDLQAFLEAQELDELAFKTWSNCKAIAKAFPKQEMRYAGLSFTHHRIVGLIMLIDPDEANRLLRWCLETDPPRTTRELLVEVEKSEQKYGGHIAFKVPHDPRKREKFLADLREYRATGKVPGYEPLTGKEFLEREFKRLLKRIIKLLEEAEYSQFAIETIANLLWLYWPAKTTEEGPPEPPELGHKPDEEPF